VADFTATAFVNIAHPTLRPLWGLILSTGRFLFITSKTPVVVFIDRLSNKLGFLHKGVFGLLVLLRRNGL